MSIYTLTMLWLGTWHLEAARACTDWAEWLDGVDE